MKSHLSSPARTLKLGLESATYQVALSGIRSLDEASSPRAIKKTLCSWYCAEPRPMPEDIISQSIKLIDSDRAEVTLVIRRGHLFLSTFFNTHRDQIISCRWLQGNIEVTCTSCLSVMLLSAESLPRDTFYKQLEAEAEPKEEKECVRIT